MNSQQIIYNIKLVLLQVDSDESASDSELPDLRSHINGAPQSPQSDSPSYAEQNDPGSPRHVNQGHSVDPQSDYQSDTYVL